MKIYRKFMSVLFALLISMSQCMAAPGVSILNGTGPVTPANPLNTSTSGRATYAATTGFFTPAATPTDVVGFFGSASKTIRILRVTISGTQTTAGINSWFLAKRNTANSGGTPSAMTIVPLDSLSPAATMTANRYTANPTTGNLVGNIGAFSILTPAPGSVAEGTDPVHDELYNGQGIVLRGTGEGLCANFAGAAVPAGMSIAFNVYWTEE